MNRTNQTLDAVNIYYKRNLDEIGGIETMTYNLAVKYQDRDILFLSEHIHPRQLPRLLKVATVEKYDPKRTYRCRNCFLTFENEVPKNIIAERYIRMAHNNHVILKEDGYVLPDDFDQTENYGVSKDACRAMEQLTGKKCGYCPNPYLPIKVTPLLKLVSPQRWSPEKGIDRIEKMARMLRQKGIPFIWYIVTNNRNGVEKLGIPELVHVPADLDVTPWISDADYLVLLSKLEGSPMAPQEALMLGKPLIVTKLGWVEDLGLDERHGFFVKEDLSDLDVEEIYQRKGTFSFNWSPPEDRWGELLLEGKIERKSKPMKLYRMKATDESYNKGVIVMELGRIAEEGEEFETTEDRIEVLTGNNTFGCAFAEVIGEVKEKKEEPEKKKTTKKKAQP